MAKRISASAMRDRLLVPIEPVAASDDWVRVLAVPGYRELLGLIARHNPCSIGALAEIAGRAQPNVSRALTALIASGLVTLDVDGRRSIPRTTESGASRARELGLLDVALRLSVTPTPNDALFSVEPDQYTASEADAIQGTLSTYLWLNSAKEQAVARFYGDLDATARRVLENWWRLFYRRDAPFRLWEFIIEPNNNTSYGLLATVHGANIHFQTRSSAGSSLNLEHASRVVSVKALETHLLDEVVRPLASRHWIEGRSARPLHAMLRRLEDSREQPLEQTFCRTAGALGLSPYDLTDERAAQIRDLVELIEDEDARLDFGSAVLGDALGEGQLWTKHELDKYRERNAMPALIQLREVCAAELGASVRPFHQGYALARIARKFLNLKEDAPTEGVKGIAQLLGAEGEFNLSSNAPGTLRAFQSFATEVPTFVVEDEGPRNSAFTFARGVGDFLAFGSRASCVAGIYTDRQAIGRAFAAEFMAPRSAVEKMVEDEDRPMAEIADHFGVSRFVVDRQYQNVGA